MLSLLLAHTKRVGVWEAWAHQLSVLLCLQLTLAASLVIAPIRRLLTQLHLALQRKEVQADLLEQTLQIVEAQLLGRRH